MNVPAFSRIVLVACALLAGPAQAHHAQFGYAREDVTSLRGTVAEIHWVSPHAAFLLDVIDSDGLPIRWRLETDSAGVLERRGWNPTAFAIGDTVTIELHARKNGEPEGILLSVTTADGEMIRVGGRQTRRQSQAR